MSKTYEERLAYINQWQKRNWNRVLEYKRRWREKHPAKMSAARANWNRNNLVRKRLDSHKRKRFKLKTDLAYRLEHYIRCKIRAVLQHQKTYKRNSTLELLGTTKEGLKQHLEKQFKPGMSWENYGQFGWHMDHIRPCASFDLTDPEQQKACFHYTNLQPLWWMDNQRKYNKWNPL